MGRKPEIAEIIGALVGSWAGHGTGGYPTIDPFEYREETSFTERADHPAVHYEQRTWRASSDGEVVSHWETGLLRLSSDGSARLIDAQAGRAETMTGQWTQDGAGWTITLVSDSYAGDAQVVASTRTFLLEEEKLSYEMMMETRATGEMSLHLQASLEKFG